MLWSTNNKVIVAIVIILLLVTSWLPEGVSNNRVIKIGLLDGSFDNYDELLVSKLSDKKLKLNFVNNKMKKEDWVIVNATVNELEDWINKSNCSLKWRILENR